MKNVLIQMSNFEALVFIGGDSPRLERVTRRSYTQLGREGALPVNAPQIALAKEANSLGLKEVKVPEAVFDFEPGIPVAAEDVNVEKCFSDLRLGAVLVVNPEPPYAADSPGWFIPVSTAPADWVDASGTKIVVQQREAPRWSGAPTITRWSMSLDQTNYRRRITLEDARSVTDFTPEVVAALSIIAKIEREEREANAAKQKARRDELAALFGVSADAAKPVISRIEDQPNSQGAESDETKEYEVYC